MTCSKHSNETFHTFKRHDDSMYKLALLGEAELQLRHWEVMKLINIASSLRNRSFRCTVVSIVALGRYRNPYRLINTLHLPCTELGIMNKRIGCTNWRRPHEVWRWSLQIVKPSSLEYQDGLVPCKGWHFKFTYARNLLQHQLKTDREKGKEWNAKRR